MPYWIEKSCIVVRVAGIHFKAKTSINLKQGHVDCAIKITPFENLSGKVFLVPCVCLTHLFVKELFIINTF